VTTRRLFIAAAALAPAALAIAAPAEQGARPSEGITAAIAAHRRALATLHAEIEALEGEYSRLERETPMIHTASASYETLLGRDAIEGLLRDECQRQRGNLRRVADMGPDERAAELDRIAREEHEALGAVADAFARLDQLKAAHRSADDAETAALMDLASIRCEHMADVQAKTGYLLSTHYGAGFWGCEGVGEALLRSLAPPAA
jgi:hypothetical protein